MGKIDDPEFINETIEDGRIEDLYDKRLPAEFFSADALTMAPMLLGKHLIRITASERLVTRIVETEAYCGAIDKASHAYGNRRTKRTETMFAAGGRAYVYLIYGIHHCLNVVSAESGVPEAVLIRAVEPLNAFETLHKNRGLSKKAKQNLTNGPGKLCRALAVDKTFDGYDLISGENLYIADGILRPGEIIAQSPRINIDYAGDFVSKPWRFFIEGHLFVSKL